MRWIAVGVGVIVCAALPAWVSGEYYVNVASQVLIYSIFAIGMNFLVGYAGLISLGHGVLFGVSAYAAAIMLTAGYSDGVAIAVAFAATLAGSLLFGVLALRGTGLAFVMITVALGQIGWGVAYRWLSVTNGENGIIVQSRPTLAGISFASPQNFYYLVLVLLLGTVALAGAFSVSPLGSSLKASRDQPRRMHALGYNVWIIRLIAVVLSGLLSGLSGLLFLYYNQFVSPHAMSLASSAEVVLMVIAGGSATLFGPIVGAAVVVLMKTVASAYIERWNFVLGAIFVAVVIFLPEGIVPGLSRLFGDVRRYDLRRKEIPAVRVETSP
ncbi:branched-chain amino acid transport system permease protein [Nitrobacteraceae bacterium AZCC 2161]